MILETICVGVMQSNCYILAAAEGFGAVIIDPGAQEHKIKNRLKALGLSPAIVVNTHGHYDHIGCDDKFGVVIYAHQLDLPLLKNPQLNLSSVFSLGYAVKSEIRPLHEGDLIEEAGITLKAIHIPGHTPGGIALLVQKPEGKILFTGDTLFYGGIGRSDLAGGDGELLVRSIKEKLLSLPEDTRVYPGHGPSTTIGFEKKNNGFLA